MRWWISLLALTWASTAWADASSDAATVAFTVVEAHCADAWSEERTTKVEALKAVLPAYEQVVQAYEAEQQSYLLYWRAMLGQCMGQFDDAKADLIEFVEAERGSEIYADQVKKATLTLRRIGVKLEAAGGGKAAGWIRRNDPLEVRVGAGAGGLLRQVTCIAENIDPQYNSSCVGPDNWRPRYSGGLRYQGRAELDAFFAPFVGLSIRGEISGHTQDPKVEGRAPAPWVRIDLGPRLRIRPSQEGRAWALRIEPSFVAGLGDQAPWTGFYDLYPENLSRTNPDNTAGYEPGLLERLSPLDGGSFFVPQIGGSLRLAIEVEASNEVVLVGNAEVAAFGPTPQGWISRQAEAAADVEVPLDATGADRVRWGGGIAVLLLPGDGGVAIGPYVDIAGDLRWLRVPEGTAADGTDVAWRIPVGDVNTFLNARVHTTRQTTLAGVVGIRVDFGGKAEE